MNNPNLPKLVELIKAPAREPWASSRLPLVVALTLYVAAVALTVGQQMGII
jgi:hypothetical protein